MVSRLLVSLFCWLLLTAASEGPGVRNGHGLVFDRGGAQLLLFGGASDKEVLGDTWAWRGEGWSLLIRSGPSARTFPAMAAAPEMGGVFLYGGNRVLFGSGGAGDTALGDFWRWGDDAWHAVDLDAGPGSRAEAAMTYDAVGKRLVLFGGYRREKGEIKYLGDTWIYDGRRWTRLAATENPPAQSGAMMIFDETVGRVVLVARTAERAASVAWWLDGNTWRRYGAPLVPPRYLASLAHNPASGGLFLFGGWTGESRSDEAATLSEGEWQIHKPQTRPAGRNHAGMAYDPLGGRMLLFGGHDGDLVFGDLWGWANGAWTLLSAVPPRQRVQNGH